MTSNPIVRQTEVDSVRASSTDHVPIAGAVENGVDRSARQQTAPATATSNPVRISRIGSDHLQVFIRSPHGDRELLALVERLEQLVDAGYDAIDVVFEAAPHDRHVRDAQPSARGVLTSHDGGD